MRTFNPEKELKKIQKGNKNKIILGVISLLLVVAIGSSYALYQIRYNKRIIYTTVEPFYSKDIQLAVYVDGVKQDEFPDKTEGYLYEGIECDNENISASFNSDTWKLNLEVGEPNKCNIKFTSNPFKAAICKDTPMAECLLKEEELQYSKELAYDDPDNNARYIGAKPANYIWFNCDEYENLTQETAKETCEKWMIIGSFKNIEKVVSVSEDGIATTEKQNLVKIVRNTMIGIIPWDNKPRNDWTNASLQVNLNNEYLTENDDGSWITSEGNKNAGSKPPSKNSSYKAITFNTLNMVENIVWNLGAYSFTETTTVDELYNQDRGTVGGASSPNSTTWRGKVALVYGSDTLYASGGEIRNMCLRERNIRTTSPECRDVNWINLIKVLYWWLLNPNPSVANNVMTFSGDATIWTEGPRIATAVHPSLYLASNVYVVSGLGTSEEPYIIKQISQ